MGLLLPEVREAAGLGSGLERFRVGSMQVYVSTRYGSNERPLMVLPDKPPFLPLVRSLLAALEAGGKGEETLSPVLALLLAQYGDTSGLDLIAGRGMGRATLSNTMIAGIALSKDPKYLPILHARLAKETRSWDLRGLLKAVRGMRGSEARAFRREANRRIRSLGSRY